MREYLENGTRLGWLINREARPIEIDRQAQEVEILKKHPLYPVRMYSRISF